MSDSLRFARWIRVCLTVGLYTVLSPFGYVMFAVLYVVWRRDPVARARRVQAITSRAYLFMHWWLDLWHITTFDLGTRLEALPDRPCVVVANHPTLMDVTSIMGVLRGASSVAKPPLYDRLLLRPLLHGAGIIKGQGGDPLDARRVLDDAVERLEQGFHMLIFPEGTRSPRDGLLPFRRAAFEIACRARVPVVSVAITCEPVWLSKEQPLFDPPHPTPELRLRTLAVDDPARVDYDSRSLCQVVEGRYQRWLREGRPDGAPAVDPKDD